MLVIESKKSVFPSNVAIIMDGNGRWGEEHFNKRHKGHIKGVERAREVIRRADDLGIKSLRLWGYSTDNWKRVGNQTSVLGNEVNVLMWLFRRFIIREADELHQKMVKVTFVGRRKQLPEQLQRVMQKLEERTAKNEGMRLEIALNYGGVQSVVDAVLSLNQRNEVVTDASLMAELYPNIPPPDFIIRTSGELRTSGFHPLASYAEWEFTDTLWPDFTPDKFEALLLKFAGRKRRYGGTAVVAE